MELIDYSIHFINARLHKSFIFNESMQYFEKGGFDYINSPLQSALAEAEKLNGFILYDKGIIFWNWKFVWWVIHTIQFWPISLQPLIPSLSIDKQSHCMIVMKLNFTSIQAILHQVIVNRSIVYSYDNVEQLWPKTLRLKKDFNMLKIPSSIPNTKVAHISKKDGVEKDIFEDYLYKKIPLEDLICLEEIPWEISSDINYPWIFIYEGTGILAIRNEQLWRRFRSVIKV